MLTSLAASGVAFMYSALVDVFALANLMTVFTYVIMMVRMLVCMSMCVVLFHSSKVSLCICILMELCDRAMQYQLVTKIPLSHLQVFAGFLINLNSLADWISWLQYLSIFRYALHVRYYIFV